MKQLLKYRVRLADGSSTIVEATNAHNAASIVRSKIGQLPNEINHKIKKDMIHTINDEMKKLNELKEKILTNSGNLDWDIVYDSVKNYTNCVSEKDSNITKLKELNGSLIKF